MRRRALCFIIPAHGRLEIAKVCLRQLVRTCEALEHRALVASAVVIADDENLDIARDLGFATVERDNSQLGRKINDGYELASMHGADYFVPFGSDDWIDHRWIRLPGSGETICTHLSAVVNEDCTRIARLDIRFGDGVRVYGRKTLERVGFRPAAEDRKRALDAATDSGVSDTGARKVFHDTDHLAIVDFKSKANLNNYAGCAQHYGNRNETGDVWTQLAAVYPSEAITEMQAVHGLVPA
jgi:hypothetical protein